MRDLAPMIYRQRLVIEGCPKQPVTDEDIEKYLLLLSRVIHMKSLIRPVTHKSDQFGWAGWIHWETSGAHLYAWEVPSLFFSVDIYTCKKFNPEDALKFTCKFFDIDSVESREF